MPITAPPFSVRASGSVLNEPSSKIVPDTLLAVRLASELGVRGEVLSAV